MEYDDFMNRTNLGHISMPRETEEPEPEESASPLKLMDERITNNRFSPVKHQAVLS